ncbi:MAG: hypothetical protein K5694_04975, partial [Bacilli bacterium]|nr:hypothetical protein [Bacilli bacterium]
MKKFNKCILPLMATATLVGCSSGANTKLVPNTADPERTFSYFVHAVDGTGVGGYLDSYDTHPAVLYLTKDPFTYKQAVINGNDTTLGDEVTNKVALHFESATTGQEQNGFITNLNSGVDILEMDYAPETAQTMYKNNKLLDVTFYVENYMPNYLAYAKKYGYEDLISVTLDDGKKHYLQVYSYLDNVFEYWDGYMYRRDWILNYGNTFDPETGLFSDKTFKEANPSWGWGSDGTWNDEIIFPSYYGLQYTGDGQGLGMGTLTYNAELHDYMTNVYAPYSVDRANVMKSRISHLERTYDTYHGQYPATISDWEWMMDISQVALKKMGAPKGYPISLYQAGYNAAGNLVSSFGGYSAEWQKSLDEESIIFGSDQSCMKCYVDTMRQWYSNGWIDNEFQSHTELLWRTDEATVRQGYVGLWLGMDDQLFKGMDMGAGGTKDCYVLGMPYPINDKYGTDENKYVMPTSFYCINREVNSIMVSTAAKNKDLSALFMMLDRTFEEDMAVQKGWGMTKEMINASQPGVQEIYNKLGFPNGCAYYDSEKKAYYRTDEAQDILIDDQYITGGKRLFGLEGFVGAKNQVPKDNYKQYLWNYSDASSYLTHSFYTQLNDDQYDLYNKSVGQLRNNMSVAVPKFIKSQTDMSEWDGWYSSL